MTTTIASTQPENRSSEPTRVELLLGDEAVGLGAVHAGIAGVFSYPGTPATEVFEFVAQRSAGTGHLSARWSANEKVAYEEALGMSYAGRRALVAMKHVGLNVAADPFMSSALTGVCAGLVLAVADDPGMHSSQNEQDSRYYAQFAKLALLEPSNQQEAYDLTRYAFELSEAVRLPVVLRLVTRLAHSRANVRVLHPAPELRREPLARTPQRADWTLLPVNARRRYRVLLAAQEGLLRRAEESPANNLRLAGRRGVITCGIAHNYVRECLRGDEETSLLKISQYPVPAELVRRLVSHCDEVLVVEDGYPFVESALHGLLGLPGKRLRGKLSGDLPSSGELNADIVAAALGVERPRAAPAVEGLPPRPPSLCQGCPHSDVFKALVAATAAYSRRILFSDIGCYTLAFYPPFEAVDTCVDMGASISMAHGAAQAGAFPVLCTIGDSTFTHSGMTALLGAARSDADMTVLILDNATVAMTGAQETLAHGEDLTRILLGLGVAPQHLHVITPHAKRHAELVELISQAIQHRGLSVIVTQRACIHAKRKESKPGKGNAPPAGRAAGSEPG